MMGLIVSNGAKQRYSPYSLSNGSARSCGHRRADRPQRRRSRPVHGRNPQGPAHRNEVIYFINPLPP